MYRFLTLSGKGGKGRLPMFRLGQRLKQAGGIESAVEERTKEIGYL